MSVTSEELENCARSKRREQIGAAESSSKILPHFGFAHDGVICTGRQWWRPPQSRLRPCFSCLPAGAGYFRLVAIAMAVASDMLGGDRVMALIEINVPTSPSAMSVGRKILVSEGALGGWF